MEDTIWNIKAANGELDWNYYRSMTFGGLVSESPKGELIDTDSFIALVPNKSHREKIKDILKNEHYGNRNSKGKKC